jgi:transmembrane sensor
MKTSLAHRIAPRLDEARIDRQLAAARVRAAAKLRVRRASRAIAAFGVLGIFAFLLFRTLVAPQAATLEGTSLESRAGGDSLVMPDGSRVVLERESKATLDTMRPDLVRWTLERGGVEVDVARADGRRFVVLAGGWEVSVLGTRFTVRAPDPPRGVEVRVVRGRVAIGRVGQRPTRILEAGETWSEQGTPKEREETPPSPAPPSAESGVTASATGPDATMASASHVAPGRSPSVGPVGPAELLARAEAARAAQRPREAAAALDELRSRYPRDPRAGLAAFELGRLRLDALSDPAGAVSALTDAIRLAPNAPFREDAEARLVEAYEASGDALRCARARAAFLGRYPASVHRARVGARCRDH